MADPTLLTIAESVKLQPPSKWHWSLSFFASRLGITPEQATSFLDRIERGGSRSEREAPCFIVSHFLGGYNY